MRGMDTMLFASIFFNCNTFKPSGSIYLSEEMMINSAAIFGGFHLKHKAVEKHI